MTDKDARIRVLEARVAELERALRDKDSKLDILAMKLDKTQSVLSGLGGSDSSSAAGDAQLPKISAMRGRAFGISAEPTVMRDNAADIKLVKYPKNDKQRALITAAVAGNEFLKQLEPAQVADIVDCMVPRSVRQHNVVIAEGDDGNEMFVVEAGEVDVFRGSGKDTQYIRKMPAGTLFGELAILYNCTRTASIRALSDLDLWVIERKVFQNIMMKTTISKQQNNVAALKRVAGLKSRPQRILQTLADSLEEKSYDAGEFVIRHGAHGNKCFFIMQGQCEVQFLDSKKPPAVLSAGALFAQETLEDKECGIENVVVRGKEQCTLLILMKEAYLHAIQEEVPTHDAREADLKLPDKREFDRAHLCPDDFEYVATLGVGGFGRVELVRYRHGSTLRTYALKTLKKRHIVETRQQEHVMNEKNIMLSCHSDFIVNLYATFKDPKYLYMAFEVCLGGELWTILRDYSHFDDGTARFYTACVLEAFQYLHSRGIIYRDLKPENLLLDQKGYAKLCDFGFSKVIGNQKTWTFCGTPEYVPPEIILNKGHEYAADYWSLGILMFELLTGNPPFVGSDPMKTYNIILKGIDVIHFPSKKISRQANQLIRRLCKPNPAERLGAHKGAGIKEIKRNKWFEGFNWEGLSTRRLHPPILKTITSPVDTANFDKYDRTNEAPPPDDFTGWDKDF